MSKGDFLVLIICSGLTSAAQGQFEAARKKHVPTIMVLSIGGVACTDSKGQVQVNLQDLSEPGSVIRPASIQTLITAPEFFKRADGKLSQLGGFGTAMKNVMGEFAKQASEDQRPFRPTMKNYSSVPVRRNPDNTECPFVGIAGIDRQDRLHTSSVFKSLSAQEQVIAELELASAVAFNQVVRSPIPPQTMRSLATCLVTSESSNKICDQVFTEAKSAGHP